MLSISEVAATLLNLPSPPSPTRQTKVAVQECTLAELRTDIQLKERRISEVEQELTTKNTENEKLAATVEGLNADSLKYQQVIAQRTEQVASLEGVLATYQH